MDSCWKFSSPNEQCLYVTVNCVYAQPLPLLWMNFRAKCNQFCKYIWNVCIANWLMNEYFSSAWRTRARKEGDRSSVSKCWTKKKSKHNTQSIYISLLFCIYTMPKHIRICRSMWNIIIHRFHCSICLGMICWSTSNLYTYAAGFFAASTDVGESYLKHESNKFLVLFCTEIHWWKETSLNLRVKNYDQRAVWWCNGWIQAINRNENEHK